MFRSLAGRNFRLFTAGQIVSTTGTWMQRIAQDWLVLQLSGGSGVALGVTMFLQFLPVLLLGLWGGVLADRYPKRAILLVTQSVMAAIAVTLGVLAMTGTAQVWHVYALAFALGMAAVVDNPARQAFVVEMVGQSDLPNAISLNAAVFNLGRIIGPAAAGFLIAWFGGTGPVFLVNAASFAAVIGALLLMRRRELHLAERVQRAKGQLREGLRYALSHKTLIVPIIMVAFVSSFGMNITVTAALMATEVFGAGASEFGLASAAFAAGAVVGALLAARRKSPSWRLMVTAALLFGALEIMSGLAPAYLVFLIVLVPAGSVLLTFNTTANATVQLGSDPKLRGRVMGLYLLVFNGGVALGAPLLGWVAEAMGPRASLIAGGLLTLAGTGVGVMVSSWNRVPAVRRLVPAIVRPR